MPVLIIGWKIYDRLPEDEQKEFALVERYSPKAPDFESGASTNSAISPFYKLFFKPLL